MEKSTIIRLALLIIIILILGAGWWFFSRTNTAVSQPNNPAKVKASEKSITSFSFSELGSKVSEAADDVNHTITLIVPHGADITKLTPVISTSDSSTVSPNSGVVQDFTNPVVYKVTAHVGSTQDYTVTVKIATVQGFGGS